MKILFITQNEGPFHMRWLDLLAKYVEVVVFHVGKYQGSINHQYISYKTIRAASKDIMLFFWQKIF